MASKAEIHQIMTAQAQMSIRKLQNEGRTERMIFTKEKHSETQARFVVTSGKRCVMFLMPIEYDWPEKYTRGNVIPPATSPWQVRE